MGQHQIITTRLARYVGQHCSGGCDCMTIVGRCDFEFLDFDFTKNMYLRTPDCKKLEDAAVKDKPKVIRVLDDKCDPNCDWLSHEGICIRHDANLVVTLVSQKIFRCKSCIEERPIDA